MEKIRSTNKIISSLADLGRLVGIDRKVTPEALSKAFLRETNFDVEMEIVVSDKTEFFQETWQIEITRGAPQHRVRMRPAGRGRWLTKPSDVPAELLRFVHADRGNDDHIESTRNWNAWSRGRWMRPEFRRHRSKNGVINFSMTAPAIERTTGEKMCSVLLSVFGVEELGPVALAMPFRAAELEDAIEDIRLKSASYFLEAAA